MKIPTKIISLFIIFTVTVCMIKIPEIIDMILDMIILKHKHHDTITEDSSSEDTVQMVHVNKTQVHEWILKRWEAQSEARQTKVLLFCYMKGGSTFFSRMFSRNAEAMFYYEPLSGFYMTEYGMQRWVYPQDVFWNQNSLDNFTLRELPDWEVKALSEVNHDMVNCNINRLPVELKMKVSCVDGKIGRDSQLMKDCKFHRTPESIEGFCGGNIATPIKNNCSGYIKTANELVDSVKYTYDKELSNSVLDRFLNRSKCRKEYQIKFEELCLEALDKRCKEAKLVTYKCLRLMMRYVDDVIKGTPDMYVIYFVRDPRAIVASRMNNGLVFRGSNHDPVLEAKYLCAKMLSDYTWYKILELKYPGVLKLVRYEDVLQDMQNSVEGVYDFINIKPYSTVYNQIKLEQSPVGNETSSYVNKWRNTFSDEVRRGMTEKCKTVLNALGYAL